MCSMYTCTVTHVLLVYLSYWKLIDPGDGEITVLVLLYCHCDVTQATSDKMLWTHCPGYLDIHRINIGHITTVSSTHGHTRVINWTELHLPSRLDTRWAISSIGKNLSIWDLIRMGWVSSCLGRISCYVDTALSISGYVKLNEVPLGINNLVQFPFNICPNP